MTNSVSCILPNLSFNLHHKEKNKGSISSPLCIAFSKVVRDLSLYNLKLSKDDIENLLSTCNCVYLTFDCCLFDLNSYPDLSSVFESRIQRLKLFQIKRGKVINKKNKIEKTNNNWMKMLLLGISKSKGIVETLKEIEIKNCEIEKKEVEMMLKNLNMNECKIGGCN